MKRYAANHERVVYADELRLAVLFAVRYALGRETAAPDVTTRIARRHADVFRDEDLRGMRHDTEAWLRQNDRTPPWPALPDANVRVWQEFVAWCGGELARRGEVRP